MLRNGYAPKGSISETDGSLRLWAHASVRQKKKTENAANRAPIKTWEFIMPSSRKIWLGLMGSVAALMMTSAPAAAQQPQAKPNILFIMGDGKHRAST
jgi:hypothetical protein